MFGHNSTIIIFVTTSLTAFFAAGFSLHELLRRKPGGEERPMIYIVESRKFYLVGRKIIRFFCLFVCSLVFDEFLSLRKMTS